MSKAMRQYNQIILALGSNLGNCLENLTQSIDLLERYIEIEKISSIYENPAMLPEGAPREWDKNFYNIVISGMTSYHAHEILKFIHDIERQIGRPMPHPKWSPRVIDIDILSYNDEMLEEKDLTLPHPGITERDFFLIALAEILPNFIIPGKSKNARNLAHSLFPSPNFYAILDNSLLMPISYQKSGVT